MGRVATTCLGLLSFACNAELVDTHDDDPGIGSTTLAGTILDVTCNGSPIDATTMGLITTALATEGSRVRFSPGLCVVAQRLNVTANNVTIEGAGPDVTTIGINATGQIALFKVDNNGAINDQGTPDPADDTFVPIQNVTLRDLGMKTLSNDEAVISAVHVHDARNFTMERVHIGPWTVANTSKRTTGIEVLGRDMGLVRNVRVEAGVPLRIAINLNDTDPTKGPYRDDNKDLDQHHFEDLTLTSTVQGDPVIRVQAGAVLRNTTFDGYQSWNRGGFLWADSSMTPARRHSNHLRFANVRVDDLCSGSCTTWAIEIVKNSSGAPQDNNVAAQLDDLLVENSLTASRPLGAPSGPAWRGIKTAHVGGTVAGVKRTVLRQVCHEGSGTATQIDGQLTVIPPCL